MSLLNDFTRRIENFLAETQISARKLGEMALNDTNFVFDLRKGKRSPHIETIDRVDAWMAAYKATSDRKVATASAQPSAVKRPAVCKSPVLR